MIDTTDLTSYISGYDEYGEPKKEPEIIDNSDEYHEEKMIEKYINEKYSKEIEGDENE